MLVKGQVIAFIADRAVFASNRSNGTPEIIALPVGIGDIVTKGAPSWLASVNACGNGDIVGGGHNQPIGAAKGAVKKPRIIGD